MPTENNTSQLQPEVKRWQLKGFIPGVEGESKAVFRPVVVLASDFDVVQSELAALREELERQKRYVEINANSAHGKHKEGQRYRDERDALQLRLNAADQRIDDLTAQHTEPVAYLYTCTFDKYQEPVVRYSQLRVTHATEGWIEEPLFRLPPHHLRADAHMTGIERMPPAWSKQ
jgi:hypothetical protein